MNGQPTPTPESVRECRALHERLKHLTPRGRAPLPDDITPVGIEFLGNLGYVFVLSPGGRWLAEYPVPQ